MLPLFSIIVLLISNCVSAHAQGVGPKSEEKDATLQFVVYLSRHGVRSPTAKPAQYNKFSAAAWPEWTVSPGYLTAHGFKLMTSFGAYDRAQLSSLGLLAPSGCADAAHVTILADSDQRTRETGKAIAEGLMPGCSIEVHSLPEGTADPLFHYLETGQANIDHALAAAAINGRIGGKIESLTEAYRPQLTQLEGVLAGCGHAALAAAPGTTLFDVPASLGPGAGDHPAEMRGPLNTASTLSENLLLEYSEGMPNVGWGCADGATLRSIMQLHAAAADFAQRTPAVAHMYASNLLDRMLKAMEQSATGKAVAGAPGKAGDRVLFLVGHDTNIATVAGALGLTWIVDGRRDDTPPGGALVFELWSSHSGEAFVRVHYTAQTLEQMRDARPLTPANPPADVPVFVPGCGRRDLTCDWSAFAATVRSAVDQSYVSVVP